MASDVTALSSKWTRTRSLTQSDYRERTCRKSNHLRAQVESYLWPDKTPETIHRLSSRYGRIRAFASLVFLLNSKLHEAAVKIAFQTRKISRRNTAAVVVVRRIFSGRICERAAFPSNWNELLWLTAASRLFVRISFTKFYTRISRIKVEDRALLTQPFSLSGLSARDGRSIFDRDRKGHLPTMTRDSAASLFSMPPRCRVRSKLARILNSTKKFEWRGDHAI
jgi:hypothetical protein